MSLASEIRQAKTAYRHRRALMIRAAGKLRQRNTAASLMAAAEIKKRGAEEGITMYGPQDYKQLHDNVVNQQAYFDNTSRDNTNRYNDMMGGMTSPVASPIQAPEPDLYGWRQMPHYEDEATVATADQVGAPSYLENRRHFTR